MNITHYAEFNEDTQQWELRDNQDTLIACFVGFDAGYENLKIFASACPDVGAFVSTN